MNGRPPEREAVVPLPPRHAHRRSGAVACLLCREVSEADYLFTLCASFTQAFAFGSQSGWK